jgi:selenocysteine-specific elongation factor
MHLILGTAGHIDHGKTALVKALTGTDTDRLPEEKARGITIDIGFASLELGDATLGIVDVPGHERFIRNMLAGATGIDLALLAVAADDSVMPQTREHFEILQLLGVTRGAIALTKCDLADDTTLEVVGLEIRELVKGSFLEGAPIVATSARTGQGIAELKRVLSELCGERKPESDDPFRMPIDRAFTLPGHGTIATGTVLSGSLAAGDELDWHRDGEIERVRVRSLNNHGRSVERLHPGMRGAINLAGVPHEHVARGQELCAPGYLVPSRVLSVNLKALARPIRHRLPVRLHLGTAEVMAKVSLLDRDRLEPGQTGLAQLFLDEPVTAIWGQTVVIRDSAAEATLGGGTVLQPNARKLRRRHLAPLERLEQLASADEHARVGAAVWFASCEPNDLLRLAGTRDLTDSLIDAGTLLRAPALMHIDRVKEIESRILKRLANLHAELPLHTAHDRGHALAELRDVEAAVLAVIVERMLKAKALLGDSRRLALASFKPKLTANQQKQKDRIVAEHKLAGLAPPDAKGPAEIYDVAVAEGDLVKLTNGLFLHIETAETVIDAVKAKLAAQETATVAEIRDWLGTTRKYAVPICEWLDRAGVTRRVGVNRMLARRASEG